MSKALLVIDMQNYFVNKHTKELPNKIRKFILTNGEKFDYILFTQFVNTKDSNFVKLMKWRKCFRSPETDIHPRLKEFSNFRNVFTKHTFSPFKSKEFLNFVKRNRINDFSICGTDTEACVLSTAVDAFDSGYRVKILKNLCGSHHGNKAHKIGVELARNCIPVV